MATRSTIAIRNANGTVTGIYGHWDGYLSHNGQILQDHYTTEAKIRELLSNGHVSSLGPEIGEKHPFDTYNLTEEQKDPRWDNWCKFYGRDRNESEQDAELFGSWEVMLSKNGQEYNYIWEPVDQCWYVEYYGRFGKLSEELQSEAAEA